MTLDDLKKGISQMSTEELMNLMKDIRTARRARRPAEPKKSAEKKQSTLLTDKTLDGLSSKDARRLLTILGVQHGIKDNQDK